MMRNRPQTHTQCHRVGRHFIPLEDRWLPSGVGLVLTSSASTQVAPLVSEPEIVDGILSRPELPARVIAALNEEFPGWTLIEAEVSTEDGTAEYTVDAEWNASSIDATLSESGTLLEHEQDIAPSLLPPVLKEWVQASYPDGVLHEVVRVVEGNDVSYDIAIITGGGHEVEITLPYDGEKLPVGRVTHSSFSPILPSDAPNSFVEVSVEADIAGNTASVEPTFDAPVSANGQASSAHHGTNQANLGLSNLAINVEAAAPESEAGAAPADTLPEELGLDQFAEMAESMTRALAVPLAGAVLGSLPLDAALIEKGFDQLVSDLDGFAASVEVELENPVLARQGLLLVALSVGSWLGLRRSWQKKQAPALGLNLAQRWSWIVGGSRSS